METTGYVETEHEGVNRLFLNALWGQKSNSVDFPTDCLQRDERLGWTGDAQVFSGTASYNMDTAAFYHKFIHDLRTEQKKFDGIVPGVIPVFDPNGPIFSSIWGDIATFLPTVLYEHYGDKAALASYYPMMKDWVDKITREDQKRGQKYLYDFGNQLGDWLALDGRTEQSMKGGTDDYYIGCCYYAMSVQKTADAAKALGCLEDEKYYRTLYEKIREAVIREYYSESGRLYRDCYKMKGGFVGAPVMCKVMAENGMEEEALHDTAQGGSKILIAYFTVAENSGVDAVSSASYTTIGGTAVGRLRAVADMIQKNIDGDLFSIQTAVVYPADGGELIGYAAEEQDDNARPELTSHIEDLEQYDTIFVGNLNWRYICRDEILSLRKGTVWPLQGLGTDFQYPQTNSIFYLYIPQLLSNGLRAFFYQARQRDKSARY